MSGRVWLDLRTDAEHQRVIAIDPPLGTDLLLYGGLATGIGTSALPLDRGNPGETHLVRLVRRGAAVHVESLARDAGVGGPALPGGSVDPAARSAVDDAFARSVLAVLPVLTDEDKDGWTDPAAPAPPGLWVDLTPLATADVFDIAGTLSHGHRAHAGPLPDAVPYALDPVRSSADADATAATPQGVLLAGRLVFATAGRTPTALRRILVDARSLVIEQRIILRPLPSGYAPLAFHPRSGSYGKRRMDPTQIADNRALTLLQSRFRPGERVVFSIDPAIPSPFREAALEGASWWAEAFDAAGSRGGFRAEVRDPAVDPWSIGLNPVWWVHRAERGWSMGHTVTDPSTGEILRGSVRLGSQRVAQLRAIFEAVLAPYGDRREAELLAEIDEALVQRVRQLVAHEIGHALGFVHNYSSSEHPVPSVMDYPHAHFRLDADGSPRLDRPYANGPGEWDRHIVRLAYAEPRVRDELLRTTRLSFLTDADGHAPGASTAVAVPWTLPLGNGLDDAFAGLAHILAVRERAIARFGPGAAAPGSDLGELQNRYGLVHLLHRFEIARVARLLGGVEYDYGLVGDLADSTEALPRRVPGHLQHRALAVLTALLAPDIVDVPRAASRWLAPASIRYELGPAVPTGARAGFVADREAFAAAAVAVVAAELFQPQRLNRLADVVGEDPAPAVSDVVTAAAAATAGSAEALDTLFSHIVHAASSPLLRAATRAELIDAARPLAGEDPRRRRLWKALARGEAVSIRLPPVPLGAPL